MSVFHHPEASNVEVRKSKAASEDVELYTLTSQPMTPTKMQMMEFPRDNIGKIWDKIEGNAVSAWLFHAFMKALGYHTELFFTPEEFPRFWETHQIDADLEDSITIREERRVAAFSVRRTRIGSQPMCS